MASIIAEIVQAHSPVYVMLCTAWQAEIRIHVACIIARIVQAYSPVNIMLCIAWQIEIDHVTKILKEHAEN